MNRLAAGCTVLALVAGCRMETVVVDRGATDRNDSGSTPVDDAGAASSPPSDAAVFHPPSCGCTPSRCEAVVPAGPLIVDYAATPSHGAFTVTGADGGRSQEEAVAEYSYPSADRCVPDAATPIASAVSATSLDVSGTVTTWSGFGLWVGCMADLSAYGGISFDLWGDAGPTGRLTFTLATSPDSPPDSCTTNVGSCDGEAGACASPAVPFVVASSPGHPITLHWSDLAGGSPQTAPDPAQIVGMMWVFDWVDWAGSRSDSYPVDVHLGSVRLVL